MPTTQLRKELLELNGIGAETADSILLYTGQHPIFVVDAYTRRVLERHDAISAKAKYDEIRGLVEQVLSTCAPEATDGSAVLDPQRPPVHEPSAMSMAAKSELAQAYNEMHGVVRAAWEALLSEAESEVRSLPVGADAKTGKPKDIKGIMRL
jgi:hypothetical protein